jgi:hypothetical protein
MVLPKSDLFCNRVRDCLAVAKVKLMRQPKPTELDRGREKIDPPNPKTRRIIPPSVLDFFKIIRVPKQIFGTQGFRNPDKNNPIPEDIEQLFSGKSFELRNEIGRFSECRTPKHFSIKI